jgi:2-C-methyl-D-erythritol 4-phosphate cytidylyltransferase / 2-C-methyl-D-erythritol 2,4-cyclodiphosphate synthase
MRTWGVLSTATADASDVARFRGLLEDHLDGVVEVPSGHRPTAPDGSMSLGELAAGLSAVPSDVERIVHLDADVLDSLGMEPVLQMLSWLDDDHAAVVRAVPVTDALKRVEGSTVVGSVDRTGLCAPQFPHIVRRAALDAALLADAGSDRDTVDLAALLVGAGHAVRVVCDGSPPVTLAARP